MSDYNYKRQKETALKGGRRYNGRKKSFD